MSRIVLHRALGSPPARSVLILANILDLKMDCREVQLLKLEHKSPEFLKINPMGTVPTLEDGDFVISESHAILKYLLSMYGAQHRERLYPSEPRTRALIDQCLFFNAGVFFVALKSVGLETFLSNLTEPSMKQKAAIENGYSVVEAYLQSQPYLAGERLSLADVAAGATATALQHILPVDENRFPKCAAWVARLEQEKSFKDTEEGVKLFGKLIKTFWENNKQKNK